MYYYTRNYFKFCLITTIIFVAFFLFMTVYSAFALFHDEISGVYMETDYEIKATIVSYDSVHFVRNTRPSNNEVRIVDIQGNKCTVVFGEGNDMDFATNVNMIDLRYDAREVDLLSGRQNHFSLEYYDTPVDMASPLNHTKWFVIRQSLVIVPFVLMMAGVVVYVWLGVKNEVPFQEHPKVYFFTAIANIVLCLAEAAILVFKLIFH